MDIFEYINSFPLFGAKSAYKPGLTRIKKLLNYLKNPEKDLAVIHIAGTNGKGSTAAILESIYRTAGYKTALYSSPHFFHFNERIKINAKACSTYELTEIIKDLKKAAVKMKKNNLAPSFFEIVTAAALKYFQRNEAEIVILEAGLGGRLDATNVIEAPLLSIISNITLEHSAILGESIKKIAAEKAGIIKQNSPVITAAEQPEALAEIQQTAAAKKAKFINIRESYSLIEGKSNLEQNFINLKRKNAAQKSYELSLLGRHQAVNTALALEAAAELKQKFPLNNKDIKKALTNVYLPARMEKISQKPVIILDAAHNPAAFKELAENIYNSRLDFNNLHFIFSILKDKDLADILAELSSFKLKPQFYAAENRSFRSASIADIEKELQRNNFQYQSFKNLNKAAAAALKNAAADDLIIAAGSFNTVFEAGIEFFSKNIRGEYDE